jgi:hypothetical protein
LAESKRLVVGLDGERTSDNRVGILFDEPMVTGWHDTVEPISIPSDGEIV